MLAWGARLGARTSSEVVLGGGRQEWDCLTPCPTLEAQPTAVPTPENLRPEVFQKMGLKADWEGAKDQPSIMVITLGDDETCFVTDRWEIRPKGLEEMKILAEKLKRFTFKSIRIDGHADKRGSYSHNLMLSRNRARSVKDALVGFGVAPEVFTVTKGWSFSKPLFPNTNDENMAHNRRVELRVAVQPEVIVIPAGASAPVSPTSKP
jgi:outer membrane protein OmpA-like peptidoglycan-associated protein